MHNISIAIGLVILGVTLLSCSSGNEDEATVNEQFVESDNYSNFAQSAREEQNRSADIPSNLIEHLKIVVACQPARQISLPFEADSSLVNEEILADRENCIEGVSFDEEAPYELFILGESNFADKNVLWVIRAQESMYKNWELLAVTYEEEQLLNFQTIGNYRDNLKENIFTNLQISRRGGGISIEANTERDIQYPIEQHNTEYKRFQIGSDGMISEVE